MFTEADVKSSAKVCVIGKTVKDKLFENDKNPLGAVIRINGIPVTVIGILEEKGFMMFFDQDDLVLMPCTTVMKRMVSQNYYNGIKAAATSEKMVDLAIEDITEILRTNHKLKEGDINDFRISSAKEQSTDIDSTMGIPRRQPCRL